MKEYIPSPIDTSQVEVNDTVLECAEILAKNTHEVWSQGRIKEGWTYGENRDNEKKTNPCLVAYEDLPESEKEYDRNTSLESIKVLIALGFDIVKR